MSSKHTPRPWRVDENNHVVAQQFEEIVEITMGDGSKRPHNTGLLALVYSPGTGTPNHHANACLIAAAPDLLSILKEVLQFAVTKGEFRNGEDDDEGYDKGGVAWGEMYDKAQAVVAKAEGRTA